MASRAAFVMLLVLTALAKASADGPSWESRRDAYLRESRQRTLAACRTAGIDLPPDFLAWVDSDPLVHATVYGCRKDPLPVLLGLRSLEIDLGEECVRRNYTQLALAIALSDSYAARTSTAGRWNDGDASTLGGALPDVALRGPLELAIPTDPRVAIDTRGGQRTLTRDEHIVNFLEDHPSIDGAASPRQPKGILAADVIASRALQVEFNEYMRAHGQDLTIDCGDGAVGWNSKEAIGDADLRRRIADARTIFQHAYEATGRMPSARDPAPTASESMAWFVRNDSWRFPQEVAAERKWPRFPLTAPWPILMMLAADDQPLREREEIWLRYRDRGELRTYGEYIGGIAQQGDMQAARRLSPFPFTYGSIQMMWKDGGVCGTMGNIGARTQRIAGVPAATAGQPGHCAMVQMEFDTGTRQFRCVGAQYASGGDESTTVHAGWNYDDKGGRRPMIFHQSIAWGINAGAESLVDTLVMRRVWDAMPAAQRTRECRDFLRAGLARNPYALAVIEGAFADAPDPLACLKMLDDALAQVDKAGVPPERKLYRETIRDIAHARVLALDAPPSADGRAQLLEGLVAQGCTNPQLLARCWRDTSGEEGFVANCVKAAEEYLASPDRAKGKRAATAFAGRVRAWAKSVKGQAARAAWAAQVIKPFEGKEKLEIRGKASDDPAFLELRKLLKSEG